MKKDNDDYVKVYSKESTICHEQMLISWVGMKNQR